MINRNFTTWLFRTLIPSSLLLMGVCLGPVQAAQPAGSVPGAYLYTSDPAAWPPPPAGAVGFPSRDPNLDVLQGFVNPPPGYAPVMNWWWTAGPGEALDKDRILWELEKIKGKGLSGLQVNYVPDTFGNTYPSDPAIFSKAWWDIWGLVVGECKKQGMGVGMNSYTLDTPGRVSLFYEKVLPASLRASVLVVYTGKVEGRKAEGSGKPDMLGRQSDACSPVTWSIPDEPVSVMAYRVKGTEVLSGTEVALPKMRTIQWTPPVTGEWHWVAVCAKPQERSLDPMHPSSGATVVQNYLQSFLDHSPGEAGKALDYFSQKELNFGANGWLWNPRVAMEFQRRKRYDIVPYLGALFVDIGPSTPKIRLDYAEVVSQLMEESYFRPIYDWFTKRGMLSGSEAGSRGGNPSEFGDYFRAVRWYGAPGHSVEWANVDVIRNKVASSIAHLYQRPRVWLDAGAHLGWGGKPDTLHYAVCKNFIYGSNLLNLHGSFYSTYGGFWEWAPSCYDFRMPYWPHVGTFCKYFERLSYLLSQGVHSCNVAILYPSDPLQAGLGGNEGTKPAFELGTELLESRGIDFDFMDDESLIRAKIDKKELQVAGEAYRVLILPHMTAIRGAALEQALKFFRAGGMVVAFKGFPEATDSVGMDDPKVEEIVKELFGVTAQEMKNGQRSQTSVQNNAAGGISCYVQGTEELMKQMDIAVPRQFSTERGGRAVHRKIGARDVFVVTDLAPNTECYFHAKGNVELWDLWTGQTRPLYAITPEEDGTRVVLPLGNREVQVVVFNPGTPKYWVEHANEKDIESIGEENGVVTVKAWAGSDGEHSLGVRTENKLITVKAVGQGSKVPLSLGRDGWTFELQPTLNNRWGDYRFPYSPGVDSFIGPETRRFLYATETTPNPGWEAAVLPPATNEIEQLAWQKTTCSYGQRFWVLGPFQKDIDLSKLEKVLSEIKQVDPRQTFELNGMVYLWKSLPVSMRYGWEGDAGPQGFNGLKGFVTDDFIVLGKPRDHGSFYSYEKEMGGTRYYLWTSAMAARETAATVSTGEMKPSAIWVNGAPVAETSGSLQLQAGSNPLLLRYNTPGRTHFVLEYANAQKDVQKLALAMSWYNRPGIIPFDIRPQEAQPAGWYRFTTPPGLRSMSFIAFGKVQGWINGAPLTIEPGKQLADGSHEYKVTLPQPMLPAATVALRIQQEHGYYGGAALPEPISLECGPGLINVGDWVDSGLECYSGGGWYRKLFKLAPHQLPAGGRVFIDLNNVSATAEVHINGQLAGVRVAAPWVLDITKLVKVGENKVEILVYNTLANHYRTIPTRYHSSLEPQAVQGDRAERSSGLIGPVVLISRAPLIMK